MFPPHSRLRRTFLTGAARDRTVLVGRTAAIGLALALPSACGNGDAETFAEATTTTGGGDSASSGSATSASSAIESPTASTTQPENSNAAGSGAVISEGAELVVSFTYEASASDRVKRPYIAVWVEDSNGSLVDTISLWYQQDDKGKKWLDELRQWYSASNGSDTTLSGATRVAGDYVVSWDGTDAEGKPVTQGDYVLYIESSREHGPYSVVSAELSIADNSFMVELNDNEELSSIAAQFLSQ